jgi:hypothetical protein
MKPQVIKLPKEEEKKEELKLIPLANNRALEASEIEAEEKAIKLPKKYFKRIPPIAGTLGYLLRDIEGGNQAVFNYINETIPATSKTKANTNAYKIYRVILMWNALDENSQNRVDVYDWLCDKVGVSKQKFYAQAAEGMFNHYEAISTRILMESKVELVNNVRQFGRSEKNFKDRELLAKATKVVTDQPLIGSIDNSTKVTNLSFESNGFKDILRSTEKLLRSDEDNFIEAELEENNVIITSQGQNQKQLTEGNLAGMISADIFEKEDESDILSVLNENSPPN